MNHNLKKVLGEKSDLKFVFNKVEEKFLKQEFGETEMTHISEVINFASILSEEYQLDDADKKIVLISAIIHDIGRCEDIPGGHTAITENGLAKYLPEDIASDGVCLGKIRSCVARHSISSKEKPETLIEKIIFDADNLTIFTLFGFKRWFFKAESWGKSKTILEAEAPLLRFHKDVINGEFLYLSKSIEIAKKSFYFKSCQI